MAAAGLTRSREVSVIRKTKEIYLLLVLLSLLCPGSSRTDKKELREIKEIIQKLLQDAQRKKVSNIIDTTLIPGLLEDIPHFMDFLTDKVKEPFPDFHPLPEFIKYLKGFLHKTHNFVKKMLENQGLKIKDYADKMKQLQMLITNFEQEKVDL